MMAALEEAKKGKYSVNKIATVYGVPRSMLKDCVTGRVTLGTKPGVRPYLASNEEEMLACTEFGASSIDWIWKD